MRVNLQSAFPISYSATYFNVIYCTLLHLHVYAHMAKKEAIQRNCNIILSSIKRSEKGNIKYNFLIHSSIFFSSLFIFSSVKIQLKERHDSCSLRLWIVKCMIK